MARKYPRQVPHKDPVCGKRVNRYKGQAEFERNPDKYAR